MALTVTQLRLPPPRELAASKITSDANNKTLDDAVVELDGANQSARRRAQKKRDMGERQRPSVFRLDHGNKHRRTFGSGAPWLNG